MHSFGALAYGAFAQKRKTSMDISKYTVKARPAVVGGHVEEKKPLRERVVLPVNRSRCLTLWASSADGQ
jgi:hypothetical protein